MEDVIAGVRRIRGDDFGRTRPPDTVMVSNISFHQVSAACRNVRRPSAGIIGIDGVENIEREGKV